LSKKPCKSGNWCKIGIAFIDQRQNVLTAWEEQLRHSLACANMIRMARAVKNTPVLRRLPKGHVHPYLAWQGTPLWRAVEKAVADLVENRDLVEKTHREYIVGYICKIIGRREKAVLGQLTSH
jgi:hypothetical protein